MFRKGADLFVDHLAVVEEDQGRNRPDLEPPAHLRVVVGVDLDQFEVTGQLPGWSGVFPKVLQNLAKTPVEERNRIMLTSFEVAKK